VDDSPRLDPGWRLSITGLVLVALALRTRIRYFLIETGDVGVRQSRRPRRLQFRAAAALALGFTVFLARANLLLRQAQTSGRGVLAGCVNEQLPYAFPLSLTAQLSLSADTVESPITTRGL
jgi:hypothetical protein